MVHSERVFLSFLYVYANFLSTLQYAQIILLVWNSEAVIRICSITNVFLKISQHSQKKYLCRSVPFKKVIKQFIGKSIRAQIFSCEFREIFQNTVYVGQLQTAASHRLFFLIIFMPYFFLYITLFGTELNANYYYYYYYYYDHHHHHHHHHHYLFIFCY